MGLKDIFNSSSRKQPEAAGPMSMGFRRINLSGADLRGADLRGADLRSLSQLQEQKTRAKRLWAIKHGKKRS